MSDPDVRDLSTYNQQRVHTNLFIRPNQLSDDSRVCPKVRFVTSLLVWIYLTPSHLG